MNGKSFFVGTLIVALLLPLPVQVLYAQQAEELHIHGETPLPDRIHAEAAKIPVQPGSQEKMLPPVTVQFAIDKPSYVTLVIEDAEGRRVRNLVNETFFDAGKHVVGWDCLDESAFPGDHPGTSVTHGQMIGPGKYTVRGIVRDKVELRYEFSVYTAGDPPWRTRDGTGGWLADHSPPSDVLFLPGDKPRMLISCFVAEAGDGLVWTDLTGRKLYGRRSLGGGGGWWGAALLARDAGQEAVPGVEAYNAGAWKGFMEIWAMGPNKRILHYKFPKKTGVGGLAAHNGIIVASLSEANELLFVDAASGKVHGTAALEKPRGLRFDNEGRLVALSGKKVVRFKLRGVPKDMKLPEPEVLVGTGLEDPKHVVFDDRYNIYVSDWGESHQVKVFAANGKLLRTIGKPGGVRLGPYDPERMDKPNGIAVSGDGHLWVAENSHSPKRVSVWTLEGKLVKAMYGPPQYGGGGIVSPDKTSFYYAGNGNAGLEFALDWAAGTSRLKNIYYLPGGPGDIGLPGAWVTAPQTPVVHGGRLYMTNAFNSNPTMGIPTVGIWLMRDGIAVPVAAGGKPDWKVLNGEEFKARRNAEGNALFAWSDLNGDGKPQPGEVTFTRELPGAGGLGSTYIAPDLTMINANTIVMKPQRFTDSGVPLYDARKAELLIPGLMSGTNSSGCGETILGRAGWVVVTGGPIRGFRNGKLMWTYPNRWPSLHAALWGESFRIARISPPAPGLMVGTTRIPGHPVIPRGSDAGEIWAITGNMGSKYLMTMDGLYVATLFEDRRTPGAFNRVPGTERGTLMNNVTPGEENFWPAIAQTSDGNIYMQSMIAAGGILTHSAIVRIDGLETIRRLKPWTIRVSPEHLRATHVYLLQREARRIKREGRQTYLVPVDHAISVDGKLEDWADQKWVTIGDVPFHHRWYKIEAAVAANDGRLYVALRTAAQRYPLASLPKADSKNVHDILKGGNAIDLMIGTDPTADPDRTAPVQGDVRLLISMVDGKPSALLCRPLCPGAAHRAVFRSAWRSNSWDSVQDVSGEVQMAWGEDGNPGDDSTYARRELCVPLEVLGIEVKPGMVVNADIGIIRKVKILLDPSGRKLSNEFSWDNGCHVVQRMYWHNKATEFVADPAGESMLAPALWGAWQFK